MHVGVCVYATGRGSFIHCIVCAGRTGGGGTSHTHLFERIIVKLFLLSDQALLEHLLQWQARKNAPPRPHTRSASTPDHRPDSRITQEGEQNSKALYERSTRNTEPQHNSVPQGHVRGAATTSIGGLAQAWLARILASAGTPWRPAQQARPWPCRSPRREQQPGVASERGKRERKALE